MRKYEHTDFDMICEWFKDRELMCPKKKDLPSIGFIEPGIAAGFLIQTDTPIAMLDFFIANPNVGRKKRNQALNEITRALTEEAGWLGFRIVSAMSRLPCIESRAIHCGMKFSGHLSMFSKEL